MTLPWNPDINPATIPDQVILRERGRRNRSRQPDQRHLLPCPWCGDLMGARERRKHKPRCPSKPRKP